MEFENLILEKQNNIGILTINRPSANAINLATMEEFGKALDAIENDSDIRVLIITGAGEKGFSAGFDVSDAANAEKIGILGSATWTRIERMAKPVIAAINGFALGGGCELALACHFRVMSDAEKAKIGLTELNLGIIPGWGGTQRMMRIVGRAKAMDLILFSRRLNAVEAQEIGLVNSVVPADAVLSSAITLAEKLAKRPPLAVAAVLKAMSTGQDYGIDEGLKVEQEGVVITKNSKDAMEGFTAFFEKREANFIGQ